MFAQLRSARRAFVLPLIAVSFSIASCQQETSQAPTGTGEGSPAASPVAAGENVSLTGKVKLLTGPWV